MDFTNKVLLITGASSGIGAACAMKFAKLSAKLALIGRNYEHLKNITEQCEHISGIKPLSIIADISDERDVENIVKETVNHYGRVDVLVNNAGIGVLGIENDVTTYDAIMATNVRGTYLLTTKVMPYLIATKGNIINMSSILSSKPLPSMTPYCMSKAAIDMFTKCSALQYGPVGVRVNSVNPGPVRTDMFRRAGISVEGNEKLFAELETASPLRKVSKVEDVAELVTFLASEKASCVTGSCYVIDCGLLLGDTERH